MSSATSKGTLVVAFLFFLPPLVQAGPVPDLQGEWARLTREAAGMGLPSRFLRLLPPEFVKLEFADLKNVAAEFHPDGIPPPRSSDRRTPASRTPAAGGGETGTAVPSRPLPW